MTVAKSLSLSSLTLHHFRNYTHLKLAVDERPVVLFGHNGAGKTNILEAISLLIPGRGLRGAKLEELLSCHPEPVEGSLRPFGFAQGDNNWAIAAHVQGAEGAVQIGTGRSHSTDEKAERRDVHVDGKSVAQSSLLKHVRMIWLTPAMEQLFLDSQSEGRRFLDRLVAQCDAEHASHLSRYENAMRDRNRLLEEGSGDGAWLSALEQVMAEKSGSIAASRLATIESLNNELRQSALSFPKPILSVEGLMENMLRENQSALAAEESFQALLADSRKQDAAAGRTLAGTHRSELVVMHRAKNLPAGRCSTGEQKALLLSIILAQSRAIARKNGMVPIVLLDEVVAHLDPVKRLELFEEICETRAQVWMTGTDASLFAGIGQRAQFFEVSNGSIK